MPEVATLIMVDASQFLATHYGCRPLHRAQTQKWTGRRVGSHGPRVRDELFVTEFSALREFAIPIFTRNYKLTSQPGSRAIGPV